MLKAPSTAPTAEQARGNPMPAARRAVLLATPVSVLGNQAMLRLQRKCDCGGGPDCDCDSKEKKEHKGGLHRAPAGSGGPPQTAPPIVHETLQSPGELLDRDTSAFFESRFGQDFSGVRIHTDARAAQSARAVNALAYTVGRDIAFAPGRFAPATTEGRRLLAHELTHTVQQRRHSSVGTPTVHAKLSVGDPFAVPTRKLFTPTKAAQVGPGGVPRILDRERLGIAVASPTSTRRLFIQPKLKIGAVDDVFEQEADRVADRVMRMRDPTSLDSPNRVRHGIAQPGRARGPAPAQAEADGTGLEDSLSSAPRIPRVVESSTMQRDIGIDQIQEQLIRAYLSDAGIVQRAADGPPEKQTTQASDEEAAAGEQILMQAKAASARGAQPYGDLESATRSLPGGGNPLPGTVRHFMESRFGHDFSGVRVHTDARAAEMAKLANARAFTIGRDVVFASGEYGPDGSESRRLLAHELTHVIQQGRAGSRLQRKIVVAGKGYSPSAKYLTFLNATFGAAMREFVEHMDNGGNPPTYSFSSYEQMGQEVRVRANAIKGIEEVHKGCCDYFDNAHPLHLDSTYWDQVGSAVDFKLKSPLPSGKKPSDAIAAIFAPGAGTRLECFSMTLAIQYYALLKGLGAAQFNAKFPSGIEISATGTYPLLQGADKKYTSVALGSKSEILPGDWVYFKNFKDYLVQHPTGYWQGENAISLGGGMYRGFGVAPLAENALNQELVNQYNQGGVASKTVADLIADGGGLLLNPVIRPIIATVAP